MYTMKLWWYSIVVYLLIYVSIGSEIYVTPDGIPCPSYAEICHNLSYYFIQGGEGTALIHDNVIVNFLEGTYQIPEDLGMYVYNKQNITLQADTNATSPPVLQGCVTIHNCISIVGCETVQIIGIIFKLNTSCDGQYRNQLIGFDISNSSKINLVNLTINSYNNRDIINVYGIVFTHSKNITLYNINMVADRPIETFITATFVDSRSDSYLNISNTNITGIHTNRYDQYSSNGIEIMIAQRRYILNIKMDHLIINNTASTNINIHSNNSCLYTLAINDLTCSNSDTGFLLRHMSSCVESAQFAITINNSKFVEGLKKSFKFYCDPYMYIKHITKDGSLSIMSTIFANNYNNGRVIVTGLTLGTPSYIDVSFTKCTRGNILIWVCCQLYSRLLLPLKIVLSLTITFRPSIPNILISISKELTCLLIIAI